MDTIIPSAVRIQRATPQREKVGHILLATGRGGTGKTTFTALASRYMKRPLLLLDIDPDQSLGDMVGVDLDKTKITTEIGRQLDVRTLSDLTRAIEEEDAFTELGGGPPFVKIPHMLQWYTRYTSEKFDLISLGPRWSQGDYRAASYLFEFIIPSVGKEYATIAVDSPAGLEHLNRKTVPYVDNLFIVLDPSAKSIKHVERVKRITREVGIGYGNLFLVGNCEFDDEAEKHIQETGETYLGRIDFDASVKEYNLKGKSLLELPENSPACVSLRRILARAGYEVGQAGK